MKLQDIETTTREAIEQLNLVRQELIETINERDREKEQLQRLREARQIIEKEKNKFEIEKNDHLHILDKTIEQIEERRRQNTRSIEEYQLSIQKLSTQEAGIKSNMAFYDDEIRNKKQEIEKLSNARQQRIEIEQEFGKVKKEIDELKWQQEKYRIEQQEFNKWKIIQQNTIGEKLREIEKRKNIVAETEKRIEAREQRVRIMEKQIGITL